MNAKGSEVIPREELVATPWYDRDRCESSIYKLRNAAVKMAAAGI
ncbi:MAG TPA: hypothetical protein VF139_02410 [Candidatus Polarisedimenticolaceae bacterium]